MDPGLYEYDPVHHLTGEWTDTILIDLLLAKAFAQSVFTS